MENKALWFVVNTTTNYEKKVATEINLKRKNRNLVEIEEILVPMKKYTTPSGLEKEAPKYKCYFYIKLRVDEDDQPSAEIWYLIRNTDGCVGILSEGDWRKPLSDSELEKLQNDLNGPKLHFTYE